MISPRSRLALSATLLFVSTLFASPAAADDAALQKAREAYKAASQAVLAGDLETALRLFEEAAAASPHAATHLAAGRTAFTLRDRPRTADHLVRALQLGLEGADAEEARRTLAQVSTELGSVRVTGVGGTARLDAGVVLATPALLHAKPGPHALQLTKGDRRVTLPLEIRAGEQGKFALAEALAEPTKPAPEPARPLPPEVEPTFPNGLTWAGAATLVLGGVVGGAAAGVGVAALSARDDFLASRTREDYDSATALETGTNVAIGSAIGLAALGAGLIVGSLFLESKSEGTTPAAAGPVRTRYDGLVIRF